MKEIIKAITFLIKLWQNSNITLRVILVVVVVSNIIIAGLVVYLAKVTTKPQQPSKADQEASSSAQLTPPKPTKPPIPKDWGLKISDQAQGATITVDYLAALKPGWVIIYGDEGGQPGKIISETIPPFEAGTFENNVFILRTPLINGRYFAVLHTEDDNGSFDFPGSDKEALDSKGGKIIQSFTVK